MEYYNTDFALSTPPVVTELPPPPPPAPPAQAPESRFWRLLRNQCAAALVLCALLLSMEFWWPSGVQTARKWLICQEVGPLEAAAQAFVQEVVQGTPVSDAVTAFCEEVLDHVSPLAADQVPASCAPFTAWTRWAASGPSWEPPPFMRLGTAWLCCSAAAPSIA